MKTCKVGLETHIQLKTKSKLFCGCPTKVVENPNTQVCEICLGHPGSKPMLNRQVLQYALKLCVALGCKIEKDIVFSRKTYFYPDMSKNFQITQYEIPLGKEGSVKLKSGKIVEIERIHIEEDPAALVHTEGMADSESVLIDYNRAGTPLVEVVTTPCMTSPAEAREFLKELIKIVKYLNVYDEKTGVLKADLNVSIPGHPRAEVKNVSGFKDAERALNYELIRQKMMVKMKKKAVQETRAWDGKKTFSLRSKETEADYGYIIEPDLPVFTITEEMIEEVKKNVPELAHIRSARYEKEHNLNAIDAEIMAMELEFAELFEKVAQEIDPKLAAKWLRRELLRVLNYNKKTLKEVLLDEEHVIELLAMVESKEISETTGQKLMEELIEGPFSPRDYVKKAGLGQVSDDDAIKEFCNQVVKEHKEAVADYKSGNEKSFHYLVGQVMRLTKGKADPAVVNKVMKEVL
jgi:aspartyl-tRNA(Asn)/glutamyl-tRNA(Gln) amidotransferase subunit B